MGRENRPIGFWIRAFKKELFMKYIDIQTDDDEKIRQSLNQYNEYLKTIKHRLKKDFLSFIPK